MSMIIYMMFIFNGLLEFIMFICKVSRYLQLVACFNLAMAWDIPEIIPLKKG